MTISKRVAAVTFASKSASRPCLKCSERLFYQPPSARVTTALTPQMMNNESAEQLRGKRQSLSLSRLYLDPNNYRFHDHPEYCTVSEEHIFDADVQRRTIGFVRGRNQDNVQDLIASIKANGWLDIDPILVERKDKGRFLVIEGNRRVATLKFLQGRYEEGAVDLGRLDRAIFSGISVNLYTDTYERDRLVMMGLHHISGKRRWPAINRAQAMKQLLPHFNNDANAVCQALGVSKREFNLSVRTLALVDVYKESDYGDQFESGKFNLFREVLASPPIRDWLGWGITNSSLRPSSRTWIDSFPGCRRKQEVKRKTVTRTSIPGRRLSL